MTEGLEAVSIFMVPPLVAYLLVVISTTKTFHEIIKTLKSYLKLDQGIRSYNVTLALQKCTMQLCYLETSFYRKLLLTNLTFTRMLRNKCSISQRRLTRLRRSTQMSDSMQKPLRSE